MVVFTVQRLVEFGLWKDVGSVYIMVVSLNDGQHVVFKAKKTETLSKISESTGPDSSLAKA